MRRTITTPQAARRILKVAVDDREPCRVLDADAQKASLALIGFDASVQKAVVGEKVWYRVKIGPFKRQDEANRARNELKENGVDTVPARN